MDFEGETPTKTARYTDHIARVDDDHSVPHTKLAPKKRDKKRYGGEITEKRVKRAVSCTDMSDNCRQGVRGAGSRAWHVM